MKRTLANLALVAALILLLAAALLAPSADRLRLLPLPDETAELLPPPSFTTSAPVLPRGQSANLEWHVHGDHYVTLRAEDTVTGDTELWVWPPQGTARDVARRSLTVTPDHTTVYTFAAYTPAGWIGNDSPPDVSADVIVDVPAPSLTADEITLIRAERLRERAEDVARRLRELRDTRERLGPGALDYPRLNDVVNSKGQIKE